jgi:hypothetical protein
MMSAEKNIYVVSIEYSSELLVHLIDIHLVGKWQSLDEKHTVLKFCSIRMMLLLPENLDWLSESSWNETAVRLYKNWDWCRSIHEICNWTLFAWVRNVELSHQSSIKVLKGKFFFWCNINKMRTDINSTNESMLISLMVFCIA